MSKILENLNEQLVEKKMVTNGYVQVEPIDKQALFDEIRSIFPDIKMQPADNLHITVSYSREDVVGLKSRKYEVEVTPKKFELLGENKDVLVLVVESKELDDRHEEIKDMGATYDWGDYKAHLTITYDGKDIDTKNSKLPKPFKVGNETVEDLDLDYKPDNEEE